MAKTILFQVAAGAVDGETVHTVAPGGANNYAVADLSAPKTIRAQGLAADDALNVVVLDYAGTAYDTWGKQLNTSNISATPVEIGSFAVEGGVKGDPGDARGIIIYTEDAEA